MPMDVYIESVMRNVKTMVHWFMSIHLKIIIDIFLQYSLTWISMYPSIYVKLTNFIVCAQFLSWLHLWVI